MCRCGDSLIAEAQAEIARLWAVHEGIMNAALAALEATRQTADELQARVNRAQAEYDDLQRTMAKLRS